MAKIMTDGLAMGGIDSGKNVQLSILWDNLDSDQKLQ